MMPILIQPYPDELMYSWFNRLAKMNLLSLNEFVNLHTNQPFDMKYLPYDSSAGYYKLDFLQDENMGRLYLKMNPLMFETLTMTRREQIMLLNRSFHKPDMSNQISHSWISKIYVCPECMKRDKKRYGESYIHVQHQLSGVTTCYKHKCKLLKYAGIPDQVCEYNPENFREEKVKASQRSLEAYTEYAHRIYQSNVSSSVILVRRALLRRIKEAGYDIKKESAKLMRELEQWEYKDLLVGHVKQNPRLILEASYSFPVEEFIPLAMFFFPDVEEFIRKIASNEPFVVERSCSKCGNKYYNSPQAIEDGWGCPHCKVSPETVFDRLLNTMGSDYVSESETVPLAEKMQFYYHFHDKYNEDDNIYISNELFEEFDELDGKVLRMYLAIRLLEHRKKDATQVSIGDMLNISGRAVRKTIRVLLNTKHVYVVEGNKKRRIPHKYHACTFYNKSKGYSSFSYREIELYIKELFEDGKRGNGELKVILFMKACLKNGDGFVSQAAIGRHLGFEQNTISGIMSKLEEKSFIRVETHKTRGNSKGEPCFYTLLR